MCGLQADCILKSEWRGNVTAARWTTHVSACPDYQLYLYYDDDCNGESESGKETGWIVSDTAPDSKAVSDLDNDGACDNYIVKASGITPDMMQAANPAGVWEPGEWEAHPQAVCEDGSAVGTTMAFTFSPMCEETVDARYE